MLCSGWANSDTDFPFFRGYFSKHFETVPTAATPTSYSTVFHFSGKLHVFVFSLQNRLIQVGRVFANGPRDLGSIPGRVIPKTLKLVLDTSLLNTQQYKVGIKGKVEQSRERSRAPLHLGVVAIEKGTFG